MAGADVDKRQACFVAAGGIGALIVLFFAQRNAAAPLAGVPKFETEAQFDGLNTDVGMRTNAGTPLDLSTGIHFFVPGYCCPGQEVTTTRHRYPLVSGGNITAVMNHGMSQLSQGSPDNDWRVMPPSEYSL